ncbi:MAG: deoxyguanosinetriphosphate triphosphohydrolase [Deltaproteobacteria bacterium]|nr:deoxyguanosinetriphosphate triphosphohydrolase [Deltaproteobacteria bacterium]
MLEKKERMDWQKLLSQERFRGLKKPPSKDTITEVRSTFMKDADRIIYSSPFRRLQDKTQVHPFPRTDYIRTRLTHSLEVSTVGRSLGLAVGRDIGPEFNLEFSDFGNVVAAACLAHDIGNPPFGHAGEEAIQYWFKHPSQAKTLGKIKGANAAEKKADFQAFNGNAQGFRILTRLSGWREQGGLRLSCATIGAFMKYPYGSCSTDPETGGKSPRKKLGYFQNDKQAFDAIANTLGLLAKPSDPSSRCRHPLAYLVEAADDICYNVIDLEDGYKCKMLTYKEVSKLFLELLDKQLDMGRLQSIEDNQDKISYLRAKAIGILIEQAYQVFMDNQDFILSGEFEGRLLKKIKSSDVMLAIENINRKKIYREKIEEELAGFRVIFDLLEQFMNSFENWYETRNNPDELLPLHEKMLRLLPRHDKMPDDWYEGFLVITDYVSGMADRFALAKFEKLSSINVNVGRA